MPKVLDHSDWRHGCDAGFLTELRDCWLENFDALATSAAEDLNRFPQGIATVEGVDLHVSSLRGCLADGIARYRRRITAGLDAC